jgi:hypothetical protein
VGAALTSSSGVIGGCITWLVAGAGAVAVLAGVLAAIIR